MGPYPPRVVSALLTPGRTFRIVPGGIDPGGGTGFVHGSLELYMYGRIYEPGMGLQPPRGALALRIPANLQLAHQVGVSTPCGALSTGEKNVFVPGLWGL